jgi:uncharacterized membrane protein YphA (DoxX/SURF4 family)
VIDGRAFDASRRRRDTILEGTTAMTASNGSRWLALSIRVLLALVFVFYGVLKLLRLQLATGDLSSVRFGEASPMLVTWHFFSLSPLYHDSIGIAQIVTGVLLLVPRTAPIGALCFFVIILNIVLINFGYDIATDVKILSSILLALDCVLIGHYWRRYRLLLISEASLDRLLAQKGHGPAPALERRDFDRMDDLRRPGTEPVTERSS